MTWIIGAWVAASFASWAYNVSEAYREYDAVVNKGKR